MSDLLGWGLGYLTQWVRDFVSETIVYRRGTASVVLVAGIAVQELKMDDGEGGIRLEYTDLDAIIATADLDFGAGPIEPLRGDIIERVTAYDSERFEVMPFGSVPCWKWSDPIGHTQRRVHAKHIDTEQFYA